VSLSLLQVGSVVDSDSWRQAALGLAKEFETLSGFYKDLLSLIPGGLLLLDQNGKVLSANESFIQEHLLSEEKEITGEHISQLTLRFTSDREQQSLFLGMVLEALEKGISRHHIPFRFKKAVGGVAGVLLSIKCMCALDGKLSCVVLLFEDLPASEADAALKTSQHEMIAHAGEIAAGVVHEIRNPLQSISGMLQLLRERHKNLSDLDSYVSLILGEINSVNHLLSEFLTMMRPRQSRFKPCDLASLCRDVISLMQGVCSAKNVMLSLDCAAELPEFLLDDTAIKHVLVNLVTNSLDAVGNGGNIEVKVFYNYGLNHLVIEVTDDGCGMTTDTLLNCTKPFFTAKTTGTGMGLPVCEKILREHGGHLEIESALGEGTTISVILPEIAGMAQL